MNKKTTIFKTLRLALSLLSKKEKKNLIRISILSFLASIFEIISLMSVYPFLSLLFNPEILEKNTKLILFRNILGFPSYENFMLLLGLLITLILIISSLSTFIIQASMNRFVAKCQERLGYDFFRAVIAADYEWHVTQNSTILMTIFNNHFIFWNRVIKQIPLIVSNLSLILIPSISLILLAPKIPSDTNAPLNVL